MTRKTPTSAEFGGGKKALALLIGKLCGMAAVSNISLAGPTGGVVTAGQGNISTPTATSTVIDQSSNRLAIDWQSFNLSADESVRFNQPTSNSVALNRILDMNPSEIFGRIDANGRVVLFNSNGILFGAGSRVNVGSILATSLNVVSFDEATGQLRLSATSTPGAIVNNGTITAAPGGSVSLVGGLVSNNGLIVADLGSVNLAAGRAATLDFYGGGLLRFDANSELVENSSGAAAGVSNAGQISANGGQVLLTTSAVQNVFDRAINNDGVVRANRIENSGGTIRLVGAGGTVVSSGELDASGVGAGSTGGSVQVLGENVGLFGNARIDVSGDAGGGVALIGGDYQGANPDVLNANQTIVGPDAQIVADGRVGGDGGRVILWSEDSTRYWGSISARGGADSGDGGFTEVSSHGSLHFDGSVNLSAPAGMGGQLLLDPLDITIQTSGGNATPNLDFGDPPDDAIVTTTSIVDVLTNTGGVTLRARDDITWTAGSDLDVSGVATAETRGITLEAGDDIQINSSITTNNGAIELTAAHPGGTLDPASTGDVTFGAAGSLNAGTAGIDIYSEGNALLGGLSGGTITVDSIQGSVTRDSGTISAATFSVSAGTSIDLDTSIIALTSATAGTTLRIDNTGALDVDAATGTALTLTSTAALTGEGIVGTSLTASGTSVDIDTAVNGTLSVAASVTTVEVTNTGVLTGVTASGSGVTISSTGSMTVGEINANTGDVSLTSVTGAILDDDAGTVGTTAVRGANIALVAEDGIGTVTNLRDAEGLSVDVDTAGALSASVEENAGHLNLNLVDQIPTVAAGDIALGTDAGETNGRLLLQTALAFDASALVGTIELGADNQAEVGLRSDDVLTLPVNSNTLFDTAPDLLAVTGDAIQDVDLADITFAVDRLIFDSDQSLGGDVVLNTTVNELSALIGNGGFLDVNETNGITLLDVEATGDIEVVAGNTITVGDVSAGTVNDVRLTANGGGAIADDLNDSTVIVGDGIFLAGAGIGAAGTTGHVDTEATNLNFNVAGGSIYLREATSAGISSFSASGGAVTRIETLNGVMTTNVNLQPTTGSVEIITRGAASDIDYSSFVIGSQTGTDAVELRAGRHLTVGALSGDDVSLQSGLTSAGSNMNLAGLSSTSGSFDNVTVNATGAVTDGSATAVVSDTLTIQSAGSVDLSTNVDTLNASGVGTSLIISESTGSLNVTNANSSGGAVNVSTVNGGMNVTSASGVGLTLAANGSGNDLTISGAVGSGSGTAQLSAGRALALTGSTVTGNTANLTSSGSMTLGTVDVGGTATLAAGSGAISSGSGSVIAGQLTINSAGSANLDTNVGTLDASGIGGLLTIRQQAGGGALTVDEATASGPVNVSTANGQLNVTHAQSTGNLGVTLTAVGGGIVLTSGTVNGGTGTVTLEAEGSISDGGTSVPSVVASQLNILGAASAVLDTNVGTLNAANVDGVLTIREQTGTLAVTGASAGGAVNLSTVDGGMTVTSATGSGVTLAANGASSDLSVSTSVGAGSGTASLTAGRALTTTGSTVTGNAASLTSSGTMTLGAVNVGGTATLAAGSGAITNGSGTVTAGQLTISNAGSANLDTNVGTLDASGVGVGGLTIRDQTGALTVAEASASGAVNVSTSAGQLNVTHAASTGNAGVTLTATGGGIVLTSGTVDGGTGTVTLQASGSISDAGTSVPSVVAGELEILGASSANLATNVDTLDASGVSGALSIREQTGALTVANASSTSGTVNVSTVAGNMSVTSASGNGVTLAANGASSDLSVSTSVGAGSGTASLTAGRALTTTGSTVTGNAASLTSSGTMTLGAVNVGGTATLAAGAGAITNGSGTVTAGQLTINNAGSANLDTNVGTLDASGVGGALTIRDQTGALTVADASATGAVNVSTVAGVLNVAHAASNAGVTLTSNGGGIVLTSGTVDGGAGTVTLDADGSIVDSGTGVASVQANQLTILGATSANLDTNVNTLDASGVSGALTIRERTGALTVEEASATGAVNVSTIAGALNVTHAASSTGAGVTLTANGGGLVLTSGTIDGGSGTVTLDADGAISDSGTGVASVQANQLTILGATSANLDTNINTLAASGVGGPLTIRERTGDLNVASANVGGAIEISTIAGTLSVASATSASAADVTLRADGGGIVLTSGTVSGGNVIVDSDGAVTDTGTLPSVQANQLVILRADSADLDTNVNVLNASNVDNDLIIREQSDGLNVINASAGGLVDVSTANGLLIVANAQGNGVTLSANGAASDLTVTTVDAGSGTATLSAGDEILDNDEGTVGTSSIAGASVILSAGNGIGSVANFQARTGSSVDVNTSGALQATVNSSSGAINLNFVTAPSIAANGITLGSGTGRSGTVLLQGSSLDVQSMAAGAVSIGASNTATVGLVTDGVLVLPDAGLPTDFAPANLLLSGTDIVRGAASSRTFDLSADSLTFIATADEDFQLNTSVGTLTAQSGGALNVDEMAGDITLGQIDAQSVNVQADQAGGAILDDGNDSTMITAQAVSLGSVGAIGSSANAATALDVDTVDLVAFAGTGDVAINSLGTAAVRASLVAGNAAAVGSNGNVSLTAAGDVRVAQLVAEQDTVNVTTSGQLVNDAAVPVVTANQLVIGGAAAVNLGTNINTLNATGVSGNLTVSESSGSLTVADVDANGAVSVSTVSGAMTVDNATSGGALTLAAGGAGSTLTVTSASGVGATLTSGGAMTIANNTLNAGTGTATLNSGGTLTLGTVNAGSASLTSVGNMTLGTVNANATSGTVSLNAGGGTIGGTGNSITANQLTVSNTSAANLNTNVNALTATTGVGALTIAESNGLTVNANATGAVNVSTAAGGLNVTAATSGAGLTLAANGGGALNVTNASGTTASLSSGGAMSVTGTVAATTGAATLTAGTTLSAGTVNASAGSASLTSTGNMTLGSVNANATNGTVTLNAGGGTIGGAGNSVSGNQLTVSNSSSVNLNTNVNSLTATSGIGALTVAETNGLTVNAAATGAVNVSTTAGALNVTAATSGAGLTLAANGGGALTVASASGTTASLTSGGAMTVTGTVAATTGAATLASGGTLTATGGTVNATSGSASLTSAGNMTLGTVNANAANGTVALNAGGGTIGGTGNLIAANQLTVANSSSANLNTNINTLTANTGVNSLTISEANALEIGSVNATSANLTAGGALTDSLNGNVSLAAGTATLTATSIGSLANTLNVNVNSLTATANSGGISIREADSLTLTNVTASANQDIIVGATGDITVAQIAVNGTNGDGRVLLAAGGNVFATGNATNITAQDVEIRAGLNANGGRIGTSADRLSLNVPRTAPGGNGTTVPSVLLFQNGSAGAPAQQSQVNIISGTFDITTATFDQNAQNVRDRFFLPTFSERTLDGTQVEVTLAGVSTAGFNELPFGNNSDALLSSGEANSAQGEGTLYIDWASFDPNVSLFGTVNPPICLPSDQSEEEAEPTADAAAAAGSAGCASTTAQYDGSFRLPDVKLVITSRGVEWVTVKTGQVTVFPLIGQLK